MKNKERSLFSLITYICLIFATILFFISLVTLVTSIIASNKMEAAPTGDEMMNEILLYGIENATPFNLVYDVAEYKASSNKKEDSYTKLAVALGEYKEAALYRYAYDYVGDSSAANTYQEKMDRAREKMEVHSYADYIDKNYEKFGGN